MQKIILLPLVMCSPLVIIAGSPSRLFADDTVDLNATLVSEFIQDNCRKCHGADMPKGDLRLDNISHQISKAADVQRWQALFYAIQSGEMPPEDAPQPSQEDRKAIAAHLQSTLSRARPMSCTAKYTSIWRLVRPSPSRKNRSRRSLASRMVALEATVAET